MPACHTTPGREAEQAGLASINPLRANGSGKEKISMGALRSRALQLCKFAG
ncbi:hypothetical protein [Nocardia sp. NPDC049149]|uniref:hypothetical protein n=1 Tax=Nocardia sp. NPDC049149 TaxID=3364315 RepID=UPI00371472EE